MSLPSAIFVGCSTTGAIDVIQKIFGGNLPEISYSDENITAYEWHIDNKYYTTDINLCSLVNKTIIDLRLVNTVEAIVICFDSNSTQGLEDAESWLPFLNVYDAEIKILVCGNCQEYVDDFLGGIDKKTAQEWCIQRGFELVELDPNTEDIDEEDDFPETTSVERIKQALNAHNWPNLQLKTITVNGKGIPSTSNRQLEQGDHLDDFTEYIDDFGNLFDQLTEIKARVQTLRGPERKEAAEQFVMSVWKALESEDEDD